MMESRCYKCGQITRPDQLFCSVCGASLKASKPQNEEAPPYHPNITPTITPAARPRGITIIALLQGLGGILLILMGGVIASEMLDLPYGFIFELPIFSGILVDPATMSAIFFVCGFTCLLVSYGFWKGKAYSRTIFMAMNALSMFTVSTIIVNAAMIIYMVRPNVKEYFSVRGGGAFTSTSPKPPPPRPPDIDYGSKPRSDGKDIVQTIKPNGGIDKPRPPPPMDSGGPQIPVEAKGFGRGTEDARRRASQPETVTTEKIRLEYDSLRASLRAGEFGEEDFTEKIQAMRFKDSSGRLWTLGRDSGAWYTFDGKRWVPGKPPNTLIRRAS